MGKVVLTQRADSGYKDVVGSHYHFPKRYLRAAQEAVGDLCLFYEPRRAQGRLAYWAVAEISRVEPDLSLRDHYFAHLNNFLPFTDVVPLRAGSESFWETSLQKQDGSVSAGGMGHSVRRIPDLEFETICNAGFSEDLFRKPDEGRPGLSDPPTVFRRPMIEQLVSRRFRDAAFARIIRTTYDARCAITGLKLINGGGRAEMEAAHIRPVADDGPDSVRNGLALSRTVHWMFDRGLIAIDNDYRLLKSVKYLPEGYERLFDPSGYVRVPDSERLRPHKTFLEYHRDTYFKG
ncbi:HNH endonuclease [uncultured Maricaulis sp.]|uniref:HNH endonuclease n=1 Tax=uncultured Maricaulis sp. TaxID=174710 RepID=UPI0030DBA155|tara:strand:+ start:105584 stop:106456 length:873 start_codon:yes stop_codon:yes gene_type:complete